MKNVLALIIIFLTISCTRNTMLVQTPTQPVPLGTTFNIEVSIFSQHMNYLIPHEPWYWIISTDLREYDVNDLYGIGFDLWYDPGIISFQSADISGGLLSSGELINAFRNSMPGKLVVGLSLTGGVPGVTGKGKLVTLVFRADSPGTTTINIHDLHIYDSYGNKVDASIVISNNIITVQ